MGTSIPFSNVLSRRTILKRLIQEDVRDALGEISRMLSERGRGEGSPTAWHRSPMAHKLAAGVWDDLGGRTPKTVDVDWLSHAINKPAGQLAQFWVDVIAADWKVAGEDWTGLSQRHRSSLEELLASKDDRTVNAEIILASQIHFFDSADRHWCRSFILPLLDWEDPARAIRTWDGFLFSGRANDGLLEAGLDHHYRGAIENIENLSKASCERLLKHLADIAIHATSDPIPWLLEFTAPVDSKTRTEWMIQVKWILDGLSARSVEYQWKRWMHKYWQNRMVSVPLTLTNEEASALATWVVFLTASIEEGVDLVVQSQADLGGNHTFLHSLTNTQLDRNPAQFARLLGHLLSGQKQRMWVCNDLERIVPRIRNRADTTDIYRIIEAALRLGCSNASAW